VLAAAHVTAVAFWVAAGLAGQWSAWRARRAGPDREIQIRSRLNPVVWIEHGALAVVLLTGGWLMVAHGIWPGRARWFDLKVGLVAFVILPLECMHAYVAHVWMAGGGRAPEGSAARQLFRRGLGVEEMLRTLGLPLLAAAVALVVWVSLTRPF
jgi:hypothetical protein